MDKGLWTASLLLIILGLILMAVGVGCRLWQSYQDPNRARVTAKVVDLILKEPEKGDASRSNKNFYYPVFEYFAEGRLYKITHPEGSYPSAYRLNQEVALFYDTKDPSHYEIAVIRMPELVAEICSLLGIISVLAGCIIFAFFSLQKRH